LSYRALADRVGALACDWRDAGLRAGDRVGIAATRSVDTIVAILAAVEAGLGYVPLDLGYPAERLRAMLTDAQVRAVVGDPAAIATLENLVGEVPTLAQPAPAGTMPHAGDGDVLYVLFTSGSTGRPKGVAMGCEPIAHLIAWHRSHARLGQPARTLQFAPLSFDVHAQEIFSSIATGGTLVLIPDAQRRDPAQLRQAMADLRVERLYLPYVALQMLAQADGDAALAGQMPLPLRDVVSAGEQLQVTPDIRAFFARHPGAALHNHYGPTESHVVTAVTLSGTADSWPDIPPIGQALPHVAIHLRPSDQAPEPGVGELFLGGPCLALGYLGQPELSAERFLDGVDGEPGRWYATGDLVRCAPDGTLTYLGRADQQLKVDGFRIEPGDIELALMAHPLVQDAAVTAPEWPQAGRLLTAHLVLRADAHVPGAPEPGPATWRAWLQGRLPDYMVPLRYVLLDKLPTTPSGKIDRRQLPLPAASPASAPLSQDALGSPLARIRQLWMALLGLTELADEANLFDVGARSLLVMRFVAQAKAEGLPLAVTDVYDRPTVAGLASVLANAAAGADSGVSGGFSPRSAQPRQGRTVAGEGIAIVGMAIRADDARDLDTFWANLLAGKEGVRRFAPHEIDPAVPEALRSQPNFVAARGMLADADRFDAAFFGISAREATVMDPQQRLFLELCWSALEDAGIDPSRSNARVGVYAGSANNSYLPAMRAEQPALIAQHGEFATMLANEKDYIATRVAHRLNLKGPAVSVHTACSTSLVAVTQAWHALAQGQCDVALAGGVSLVVPQAGGHLHVEGGMESADGRCRPFDALASGTLFGSGGGVVVLKRLSQALADGDPVYAVIKGVGLNNDGGEKASFTAPSVSGQVEVIRMALDEAGVNPRSIGFVEAHGTGTALGDPIEVAALTRAWSRDTTDTGFCHLGSVKGHVGHLVAAAGVVGLIKATLALQREQVPGTLHFEQPNPQIDFAQTPFVVSAQNQPWPRGETPRRAAVSSFGVGGTNAHVVLEEPPRTTTPSPPPHVQADVQPDGPPLAAEWILPLSAKSTEAVQRRARQLAEWLSAHPEAQLAQVAGTLMRGRQAMPHRLSVIARDVASAIEALRAPLAVQHARSVPRLVYLFPGQGAQHPGMARGLVDSLPAFRLAFDEVLAAAPAELAARLRHLLTKAAPDDEAAAAELAQTHLAQPALFAMSWAYGAWLDSLGLTPSAMIGHSIGEYAAACRAGVMRLPDAMAAVVARGEAMFAQAPGAMLAVRASAEQVQPLLPAEVDIAALNAPQLTVVAGPHEAIDALAATLASQDIGSTALKVSHAFHSAAMDGALPLVQAALSRCALQPPRTTLYSCVSGERLGAEATDPAYWARQVRAPVAFSRAVQAELAQGEAVFVEVGPSQALAALLRQHRTPQGAAPRVVSLAGGARSASEPSRHALMAVAQLWNLGADLAWPVPASAPRLHLPGYPFEGPRHWFERRTPAPTATSAAHLSASTPVVTASLPLAPPPVMSRLPRLEQELTRILTDVAGIPADEVTRDATFMDQGLDSLSLTQATLALEKVFGLKLRFRRLLEDLDTLGKLAAFLDAELPSDRFAPAPATGPAAPVAPQASPPAAAVMAMSPAFPVLNQPALASGDAVHQLIQQQMQLMAQQLALLSGQPLATTAPAQLPTTVVSAEPSSATRSTISTSPAAAGSPVVPVETTAQPTKMALVEKPFGASARIVLQANKDFTPAQQAWVDDFIQRYNQRTGRSKAFSQQHRKLMSDPRVVTGFNPLWKDLVYPIVADRSEGARVWDIDGNAYIDLLSCFGANFLGYKPADVTQAMIEQLQRGIEVGPQHPLAADVAQLISEFTGMERVAFCNTGSEAVMGAMRMARTVTGRQKIAIFNNSYHGIFDEVVVRGTKQLRSLSAAPGILANAVENILVLDYDSPASLEVLRGCAHELAAIMIEPIQNKYPTLQPRAFVQQLREIATQGGAALIFDEVVTGFRVAPGGAQAFYGVRADIATYGKIIGGGLPFAAIAGGTLWMDALDGGHWQFGDDSYPEAGVTYFAGTFVRHPLALAAAHATLLHIKRGGQALYDTVNARTQRMVDRINAAFAACGAPAKAVHCASLWRLSWDDNVRHISLFYYLARFRGLHLYEQFGHFVTEAMSDADTDQIADTFIGVMTELIGLGLIEPRGGHDGGGGGGTGLPGNAAPQGGTRPAVVHGQVSETRPAPTAGPLHPGQTERWLAASFDAGACRALNEAFCLSLSGPVNHTALHHALTDVLARHDAFRIAFDTAEPLQRVQATAQVDIQELDLRQETDADLALEHFCREANRRDFALDRAPLAAASLLRLADGRSVVHLVASHLVFDGWAASVFNADLAQAYQARCAGAAPQWPPAESPLSFAQAEAERFEAAEGQESLAYWTQQLRNPPAPLSLGDLSPGGPRQFKADTVRATLDASLTAALRQRARQSGATVFQMLLTAVTILLRQQGGQREFVVSVPYASQALALHGPLLADGVLDLPLRLHADAGDTAQDVLARVRRQVMDAMDQPVVTQGTVARALGIRSAGDRPPFSSIIFNLNPKVPLPYDAALQANMIEGHRQFLLSELLFNFYDQGEVITLDLHHSAEHFSLAKAQSLTQALIAQCRLLVECLDEPIALTPPEAIDLVDPRIRAWNAATVMPRHAPGRVDQWISAQAARTPDAIALVAQGQRRTYAEMARRAAQFAQVLHARGVKQGDLVGVSMGRGIELVPALLGIFQVGAAYVPLDPNFPAERLRQMAEDAELSAVITEAAHAGLTGLPRAAQVRIDDDRALIDQASTAPLPDGARDDSDAPSYVIYTSGSTGKPKGVVLRQSGLANLMTSMLREPGITAQDRLLAVITLSFDMAVPELFLPLTVGARVVIAQRDDTMDGEVLSALIASEGINVMQATPTTWHILADAGWQPPKGFKGMTGGEPLSPALARHLLEAGVELWNLYGPTETTVYATGGQVTNPSRITIGRPVDNTQAWILDEHLQPCAVGQEGELCIGGHSLAVGYLKRPELTAEKFIDHPLVTEPGGKLYRTGDLARWAPDGEIEHLGRMDYQIKIRGYRIELGEIEAQLAAQPGISRTVVMAREDTPGDIRLVAYVVPQVGHQPDGTALRATLRTVLPDYMVPQAVVVLETMPLLPNGKTNRKALPAPAAEALPLAPTGTPPASALERSVAQAMQTVLKTGPLSLEDDFFGMGGHSLLAARLIALLNKECGVHLQLRALFESPTVGKLAASIARQQGADAPPLRAPLVRRADRRQAPLTVMQQRVVFMEEMQPGRVVYHAPSAHRLRGPMNLAAFNQAYRHMAQRQEAFHTTIERHGGELVQRMHPERVLPDLPLLDLGHLPQAEREAAMLAHMNALVAETFALDQAPLIRSHLYRLAEDEHGFFLMAHHIVWDGASFDVLYRELSAHYDAFAKGQPSPLPELAFTHGDFCAWHRDWMGSEEIAQQLRFWEKQNQSHPPQRPAIADRVRPAQPTGEGATAFLSFEGSDLEAIRALARRTGSPVSVVFMAAYVALMSEWLCDPAPGIGLPVRGRPQPELEQVMGFFNNMLPLRLSVPSEASGLEAVRAVRQQITDALANQDVPFELIAQHLRLKSGRLYQVLFNYQDVRERILQWGPLQHERINLDRYGATEDLNFWLVEEADRIAGGFQHDTDVILPATAAALCDRYSTLVRRLAGQPDLPLWQAMAPSATEQALLARFSRTHLDTALPSPEADPLGALQTLATRSPDTVVWRSGERTLVAAELQHRVTAFAHTLSAALGNQAMPQSTGHVAVALTDPVGQLVACLATLQRGLRCQPLPASWPELAMQHGHCVALVTDTTRQAPQGVTLLAGHQVPGYPLQATVAASAAPEPTLRQAPPPLSPAQSQALATRLLQLTGLKSGGGVLAVDDGNRGLLFALALSGLAAGAELTLLPGLGDGQTSTLAAPQSTAGVQVASLGAQSGATALAAPLSPQTILIAEVGTTDPAAVQAWLAGGLKVLSVFCAQGIGAPLAAGWVTEQADTGTCGQPLLDAFTLQNQAGRTLGLNAPGTVHLGADALAWPCGDALRWRADGVLQWSDAPRAPLPLVRRPVVESAQVSAPSVTPLPASGTATATRTQIPPLDADAAVAAMAAIWANLLQVTDIGPQDNFFELGG
ncbi:non-ribosomal peptide synthetase/type I polyketide synthase, partial [Aquabacterium sp.]|uniref:non-ribosomal peptide synthetase/type I polyketide synthase n=1 Tax=Aquabacterium sp. TaxID=1872578 RepID=UPI0025C48114